MITSHKIIRGIKTLITDVGDIADRENHFYRVRPRTATLFLTYRCNSHCSTCTFWQRPALEEKKKEIGLEEWKIIIDKLAVAGVTTIEPFGGNVLLRKDLLIPLLKYMRDRNFVLHLPINQIGLDEDIAAAIVSTVDFVYISTDGVAEYQDRIRGQKGAARRAENAVTQLRSLKGDRAKPILICNTTVSKYNIEILEKIAEYARTMGFDEIHYEYAGEHTKQHIEQSLIDDLRPTPYFVQQNGESILVDPAGAQLIKRNLDRITKKYAGSGFGVRSINIDILSEQNLYQGTIPHDKCYVERLEVTVDPAGNAIICPFINNYIMGSLVEMPFDEVWNNGKHRRFREVQNAGKIKMCEHCILGVQRNPGIAVSLQRLYLSRIRPMVNKLFHQNGTSRGRRLYRQLAYLQIRTKRVFQRKGFLTLVAKGWSKINWMSFKTTASLWLEKSLDAPIIVAKPQEDIGIDFQRPEATPLIGWLRKHHASFPWIYLPREIASAYRDQHIYVSIRSKTEIIGYIKVGINNTFIHDFGIHVQLPPRVAFIYDTFVIPPFRRKHIMTWAIAETGRYLQKRGYDTLWCHIEAWNSASIRAFQKVGFKNRATIRYSRVFGIPLFTRDGYRPFMRLESFLSERAGGQ